jgi:hypothetical protein
VIAWLVVLVAQTLGASLWWWLQPGGFGLGHARFWLNRFLPIVVLGWCIGSLVSLHREDRAQLLLWLPAWPAAWGAGAIASRIVFPISLARLWLGPLFFAVLLSVCLIPIVRGVARRANLPLLAVMFFWSAVGVSALLCERPQPPGTRPLFIGPPTVEETGSSPSGSLPGAFSLGRDVLVQSSDASLSVRLAPLTVIVSPLLRFLSCAPDGCWTVFARPKSRAGPEPRLVSGGADNGTLWLAYDFPGEGSATLQVARDMQRRSVEITALTELKRSVFSHLNSYCDLEVRGHRRLSLGFSPCPEARIEVVHFDYPFGRPARFAFVDEDRRFRVVEASSGEKGPFRTLAEGRLASSDPLVITLYDEDREVGRVTLADWSAQVSTQLSPTAGWNVPVNAIEFSLSDENPTSPASIFVTLAATSVGRGWDCVGHAAGTYRNRITIDPSP